MKKVIIDDFVMYDKESVSSIVFDSTKIEFNFNNAILTKDNDTLIFKSNDKYASESTLVFISSDEKVSSAIKKQNTFQLALIGESGTIESAFQFTLEAK